MSEWIDAKAKLPPLDETVLVCLRSGYDGAPVYRWGCRVDEGEGWMWACGGQFGITPGDRPQQNDMETDDDYQVTHWQPLAVPPYQRALKQKATSLVD